MKRTEYTSALLSERYTCTEHPSGLRILIFPKKMTTVYTMFAVNFGALDTALPDGTPLPDGTAHFLEHKLFEDENGEDAFAAFSAYGADVNAYTSWGRTAYLFSTTAHFSECLSELLHFVMHPHFTEKSVGREKGIIAQEIKMYGDQPWEQVYQNLLCALYREHPVRRDVCGSVASIGEITPDVLSAAYGAYYRLSNMALAVCGDVSEEEVLRVVEEHLSSVAPAPPPPRRRLICEAGGVHRARVTKRMQVAKPLFCIGIKDGSAVTEREEVRRELAVSLLCETLFSQSGRFYESLFEEELIGSLSWEYTLVDGARFLCLSGDSHDPEEVLARLERFLEEVCETGVDPEELELCRRTRYASKILDYDSTEEIASLLLDYAAFDGQEIFPIPELLMQITPDEVNGLLRELYRKENLAFSTVYPLETEEERS